MGDERARAAANRDGSPLDDKPSRKLVLSSDPSQVVFPPTSAG